ncbi:MAG: hypothetical protein B6I17_03515 [Tenericutes bacterium 4572_104]|nr:MAG: hypothetical protein B6I17_03515 [Tenericutes bacterium 4572_104]
MNNKLIGLYLQKKRKELGITQKELSERMGVTYQAVSRWENGDSIPDLDSLSNLADFYKISIDEILQRNKIDGEDEWPTNLKYVITFIVSIAYFLGDVLLGFFIGLSGNYKSWGYLLLLLFFIAGLFLHNIFFIISKKKKEMLMWYLITYIPFVVALLFFYLIESGVID